MEQPKTKIKIGNVVANAQNELRYASKKHQTTKLREGAKLLSGAGKTLNTIGAVGKGISGLALLTGGITTSINLYNSLKRGEGFARLLKIGK